MTRTDYLGRYRFTKGFPGVGGMSFEEAWGMDKTFVYNALRWESATGTLGLWKEYCHLRENEFPKDFEPLILRRWKKIKKKND